MPTSSANPGCPLLIMAHNPVSRGGIVYKEGRPGRFFALPAPVDYHLLGSTTGRQAIAFWCRGRAAEPNTTGCVILRRSPWTYLTERRGSAWPLPPGWLEFPSSPSAWRRNSPSAGLPSAVVGCSWPCWPYSSRGVGGDRESKERRLHLHKSATRHSPARPAHDS